MLSPEKSVDVLDLDGAIALTGGKKIQKFQKILKLQKLVNSVKDSKVSMAAVESKKLIHLHKKYDFYITKLFGK